ncbi:polymeric immunoglobulin receptor-like [Dicentrarchus labrax]|uniref:polymeric immunoglobulin receptor-like n=1 Tax=Dicentrarchus labrax TaxID=13489 RepID=UPI0021F69916|nr:polymeric immunoglobulin receptor-like [Dicentrarchus labrax]
MALHLSVLLIFTGLTGIHSVTTVSKVSVKAGGSISIPCLYEPEYTHHVKYLCKGYTWELCSYSVRTDQPDSSGKFSISDDKQQRIFTVTINNLMMKDSSFYYWCAVEINVREDERKFFELSVTTGWPQLFVDHQEITGFNGEDVTIHGSYSNTGEIEWCRLGRSCVKEPSGSIDGTRVTINANVSKVFTVTMSGLRTESSGWYFCTKGGLQMPVHVTVKERPSTTEPVNHTAVSAYGEPTTVQGGKHRAFIIPLSLLIFILMVASFIWFMLRRHKQTKAPASAATAVEEEVSYSAVEFKRKALVKVEAADEDVTYSTLALQ